MLIMVAIWNRADHYIFALWFLPFFLFSLPNLRSRRLDVYHTSTHGACGSLKMHNAKKSSSVHQRTTLSGYMFATKARIDNRKKLVKQQYLLQMYHNMVNLGLLVAEIGPVVWDTPANFNGFCIFAALLHSSHVVGVNQTLQRRTEGAIYVRQGDHHVGHWPTF